MKQATIYCVHTDYGEKVSLVSGEVEVRATTVKVLGREMDPFHSALRFRTIIPIADVDFTADAALTRHLERCDEAAEAARRDLADAEATLKRAQKLYNESIAKPGKGKKR